MTSVVYTIYGFEGCGYYHAALELLKSLASQNKKIKIQTLAVPRPKWSGTLETLHKNHKLSDTTLAKIKRHTTSPLILKGNAYIGGHDKLRELLKL